MNSDPAKIGVFICQCGKNVGGVVDTEEIAESAKELPNVVVSKVHTHLCSQEGLSVIQNEIKEQGLDRLVVAACTPKLHEDTFRNAAVDSGLNPYCLDIANIREQCSWVHIDDPETATEKARYLVVGSVARANVIEPLEDKEVDVTQAAMVIGGGVAGIQAALDIADNGFKVYLVEKDPSIGGRMAQLDKTFPTLDCSACILTPKMVDVARHPNIELLSYSEVVGVEGHVGDFKVKVLKKPRYVDMELCRSCGECAEACRLAGKIPSEFDVGIAKRSAIYIPFPQAIPQKYVVDPESCVLITRGVCGKTLKCADACEPKAIDFDQKEEEVELNVGVIVIATGYDLYEAKEKEALGYGVHPEVITALELERLVNASGPTLGHVEIEGKEPKDIVFISCVGSRERDGNKYCSRFCCMYTAKLSHMMKDKFPDANVSVYYTDMRAFGKGFDEFYEKIKGEGIDYLLRGLDDSISVEKADDRVVVKAEGHPDLSADMVVLATGAVPKTGSDKLAEITGLKLGEDGFFSEIHPKIQPVDTVMRGIYLAGCCQSPKDIPDSVQQASAAAARASRVLSDGKMLLEPVIAEVKEAGCGDCQICLGLCPFGALAFDPEKKMAKVDETLCRGCGICAAACPTAAIWVRNHSQDQFESQIEAIMGIR
jgi:heterodisulfide reductase subunit A